jgi:hypothetical protein
MKKRNLLVIALCVSGITAFGQWERSGTVVKLEHSGDKVGIGTSSPAEKLHINGAIRGNESNGALKIQTSRGYLVLGPKSSGWCHMETNKDRFYLNKPLFIASGRLVSYSTHDLKLCTGESGNYDMNTRITIKNSNGYVGIGTTDPQSELAVKGIITARELVITMNGWSDYVFENDYKLMPINELEQHIKENKHLPGIPTEKEIMENGVQIGSVSASLLGKIEELTLYIIEQNKRIESLEKEIEELKTDVN